MKKVVISIFAVTLTFIAGAQEVRIELPDSLRTANIITSGASESVFGEKLSIDYEISTSSAFDTAAPASLPLNNYGLYNPYRARPFGTYADRWMTVSPFGYQYENLIEGGNIAGMGGRFSVSDNFSIGASIYMSSAYFGPFYPDRINNLSFQLNLEYRLAEWIMLRGFGQVSVKEGINPMFMPAVGGGTGYGAGLRVMFTENIGVEGGVRRYYYKGKWHTSPYLDPVVEVKVRKKNPYPNLLPGN